MIRKASEMKTEARAAMRGGTGTVTIQHFFEKEEITAKSRLCGSLQILSHCTV